VELNLAEDNHYNIELQIPEDLPKLVLNYPEDRLYNTIFIKELTINPNLQRITTIIHSPCQGINRIYINMTSPRLTTIIYELKKLKR